MANNPNQFTLYGYQKTSLTEPMGEIAGVQVFDLAVMDLSMLKMLVYKEHKKTISYTMMFALLNNIDSYIYEEAIKFKHECDIKDTTLGKVLYDED